MTTTREKLRRVMQDLDPVHPKGVPTDEIYDRLNRSFPRSDGRPWKGHMAIPGDYAVWSESGEPCNPSAANDPNYPKFLIRVSAPSERPARYRLVKQPETNRRHT